VKDIRAWKTWGGQTTENNAHKSSTISMMASRNTSWHSFTPWNWFPPFALPYFSTQFSLHNYIYGLIKYRQNSNNNNKINDNNHNGQLPQDNPGEPMPEKNSMACLISSWQVSYSDKRPANLGRKQSE